MGGVSPELIIGNHQSVVEVPEEWLERLREVGFAAMSRVREEHVIDAQAPLPGLDVVEVALVDDGESARVHEEFMGIEGATDVITFAHGEIVIGVEVAERQAGEYDEPVLRELVRYVIHGLLHLAGHEDEEPGDRERMERVQEALVGTLWE